MSEAFAVSVVSVQGCGILSLLKILRVCSAEIILKLILIFENICIEYYLFCLLNFLCPLKCCTPGECLTCFPLILAPVTSLTQVQQGVTGEMRCARTQVVGGLLLEGAGLVNDLITS